VVSISHCGCDDPGSIPGLDRRLCMNAYTALTMLHFIDDFFPFYETYLTFVNLSSGTLLQPCSPKPPHRV
jgi:hypothetical protein